MPAEFMDRLSSVMSRPAREVESEALKAAPERACPIAQRLISSLDRKADTDVERVWLEEAKRRLSELKSGKLAGIPADKVVGTARSALR